MYTTISEVKTSGTVVLTVPLKAIVFPQTAFEIVTHIGFLDPVKGLDVVSSGKNRRGEGREGCRNRSEKVVRKTK